MKVTRDQIIEAIQRTAKDNGGVPVGIVRFTVETGISVDDCIGVYWRNWSDALIEAGFSPNQMNPSFNEEDMLRRHAELSLQLGRLPTKADMQLKRRSDADFPAWETYRRRFGSTADVRRRTAEYCLSKAEVADYSQIYQRTLPTTPSKADDPPNSSGITGYVYLLRHGNRREYKIGRTTNPLRREGAVAVELPEKVQPIHVIPTDDPSGIESYWHNRFAKKRKNGEWFELDRHEVAAFKRRKYM